MQGLEFFYKVYNCGVLQVCCDTILIFYHVSKLDFGELGLNNGPQTPEEMRRKGKPVCVSVILRDWKTNRQKGYQVEVKTHQTVHGDLLPRLCQQKFDSKYVSYRFASMIMSSSILVWSAGAIPPLSDRQCLIKCN